MVSRGTTQSELRTDLGEKRFTYEEKKNAGRNKLTVGLGALLGWNWVLETHSPYGPELSVPVSAEESIEASPALCAQKTPSSMPHTFTEDFHTASSKIRGDHVFKMLRKKQPLSWPHGTSPCASKGTHFPPMRPGEHTREQTDQGGALSYSRVEAASLFGIGNRGMSIPGGKNVQSTFQERSDETGTELGTAGQPQCTVSC